MDPTDPKVSCRDEPSRRPDSFVVVFCMPFLAAESGQSSSTRLDPLKLRNAQVMSRVALINTQLLCVYIEYWVVGCNEYVISFHSRL